MFNPVGVVTSYHRYPRVVPRGIVVKPHSGFVVSLIMSSYSAYFLFNDIKTSLGVFKNPSIISKSVWDLFIPNPNGVE